MLHFIIRTDKFDWNDIDFKLIIIDSIMVPTIGSTFTHRIKSGEFNENFKFIVTDVEYVSFADYFNTTNKPDKQLYNVNVYIEPVSENATYKRTSYLLGRE